MLAGAGGPVGVTVDDRVVFLPPGRRPVNPLGAGSFPVFRFGWAPAGLATRRQLAALGLRPGGQQPWGRIEWRAGRRFADLYVIADAAPKRPVTPGKAAALAAAMRARRTCTRCGTEADYCLPVSLGRRCLDCLDHDHNDEGRDLNDSASESAACAA